MDPAPRKQNAHDQQRTLNAEDPINMVTGEVRVSRCETCESDVNAEVGKRLDEGLSTPEGLQGEQAQEEEAHQNAENSRPPWLRNGNPKCVPTGGRHRQRDVDSRGIAD